VSETQTTAIGFSTGSTARGGPRFSYSQRAREQLGLALIFSQGVEGRAGNRGLGMKGVDIFIKLESVNHGSRALIRNLEEWKLG